MTHFETAKNFCCMERIKGRLGIIKRNWAKGTVNQLSVERFVRNKEKNKITNSKEIDQEGSNPLLGQYEGRPPRKKTFAFTHPNSGKLVLFSRRQRRAFDATCISTGVEIRQKGSEGWKWRITNQFWVFRDCSSGNSVEHMLDRLAAFVI